MKRGVRTVLSAVVLLCAALPATPSAGSAQAVCQVTESEVVTAVLLISGTRLVFATRPVVDCDDGTRVQADSAEVNEGAGITRFFGNVQFEDPTRRLTSGFAEFYERQDRLFAWEGVILTQSADSTVIRGDTLEYYRASNVQAEDLLSVRGGRVRSSLPPRGGEGAPYDVESNRLTIQGEDRVTAQGDVSVVRDSLRAWGDTMTFDPDTDRLRLGGEARIEGETYDLRARVIELLLPGDSLREVLAINQPVLITDGLELTAPREIRIDFVDGEIDRLVAVGLPPPAEGTAPQAAPGDPAAEALPRERPRADARDFVLEGDSLDILAPLGELDRVVAVGMARGESLSADSSAAAMQEREQLPPFLWNDWIEGDTIVAIFLPVHDVPNGTPPDDMTADSLIALPVPASPDTQGGSRYRLENLTARGNARSLYRVSPSDSAAAEGSTRKAIHYVLGSTITVTMVDGEVDRMDVEAPRGIHLEPRGAGDRGTLPGDTLPPPDTLGLPDPPGGTPDLPPAPSGVVRGDATPTGARPERVQRLRSPRPEVRP